MTIWRRVAWYALGVGFGTLMAYFFFSDRDFQCTYFPNNRVLVDLHDQPYRYVAKEAHDRWIEETNGDSTFLEAFLIRGDIDFSESKVITRTNDLKYSTYLIELNWEGTKYRGEWEKRTDSAVLKSLTPL